VKDASPQSVNRIICYCDDCQATLHYLGRADLLDPHGGTDIVQVAPAALQFHRGADRIAGLRLSPKGLCRWYASCCKTPVGNTAGLSIPFVGILAQAFDEPDAVVGKPVGAILGQFAIGAAPEGSTRTNPRLLLRLIGKVLSWKITGKTWPHPFFDRSTRAPSHPMTILTPAEREALRPLCGPRPPAQASAPVMR
jgi:hypothetical protein